MWGRGYEQKNVLLLLLQKNEKYKRKIAEKQKIKIIHKEKFAPGTTLKSRTHNK